MKAKNDLILREIAGETILIPTGEVSLNIHGMISMTESGAVLWKKLQEECTEEDLVQAILAEYEVDHETAARDVKAFIDKMGKLGIIEF